MNAFDLPLIRALGGIGVFLFILLGGISMIIAAARSRGGNAEHLHLNR